MNGKRVYRNRKIGTVREFPHRRDALKAVETLRASINSGVHCPETVGELITHYQQHKLTLARKASSTIEVNRNFIKLYIKPTWDGAKLSEVKTVNVESWLEYLPKSPATWSKIKAVSPRFSLMRFGMSGSGTIQSKLSAALLSVFARKAF